MPELAKEHSTDGTIPHFIDLAPAGKDGMACVRVSPDTPLSEVAMSLAGIALVVDEMTRDQEIRGSKITNVDGQAVEISVPGLELSENERRDQLAKSIEQFLNPDGWRV